MTLEAIRFNKSKGELFILNQLLLPKTLVYEPVSSIEDGWNAIKLMKTRGAPAIAILGSLTVAIQLKKLPPNTTLLELATFVRNSFDYLVTARPTAVNIAEAARYFSDLADQLVQIGSTTVGTAIDTLYDNMAHMLQEDIEKNKKIGDYGAKHIISNTNTIDSKPLCHVLTHCNTGSLATGGYGTALGVIRSLHELGVLERAYCTETRPYNQGSRLTAFELVHEKIPSTLICDSMAAFLMMTSRKPITAVVVGADRIAANGDTANKIGTYQLAVSAKHHGVPFYIAAPISTIDFSTSTGSDIVIEERKKEEMINFAGCRIAPEDIDCWNPAFDVTPRELITGGIITEYGVCRSDQLLELQKIVQ